MPNIDNLEIKISTSAGQAARELESLASSLDKVKGAGNYPTSLTSYAKNLDKLGATLDRIDSTKLAKLDTLGQTLKSLEGVGNVKISKTLTDGIENIINQASKISEGDLKKLERLSKAIGSLGNLQSGEGNSLAVKFSGIDKVDNQVKSINGQLKISTVLTQGFKGATDLLGKSWTFVVTSVTGLVVGFKKVYPYLKEAIELSNSYIKTLNKFNVVMGDYAQSEYDYAMRVNEVMGIDPAEWLDVESTFMTLGTGFGIAADRASVMSRQLTQLSYDIASFNNIDISDSIQRVQSAFAGELEPVRRLGYDLSQTRLQMYATELGIDSLVSSMTQAEKAQLRYYALMNQVVEAQHDMAITLNAPSNQLRILHSYLNQASRALGNVFIPLLNKVIPYAIAGARAIRTFADAIASLFGFELPTFDDSIRGMSNLADTTATVADNLGSGARQAQKFKDNLQKFDELNVLKSPNDNGGSGSGDVLNPSNWDWELPTYDFLEGATQSRVDSIYDRLMRALTLQDLNANEAGRILARKFNDIISHVDTYSVGRVLGTRITDIFDFALGFLTEYDSFGFGARIADFFNGLIDGFDGATVAQAISMAIRSAFNGIRGFLHTLNWDGIGRDIGDFIRNIDWYGILVDMLDIGNDVIRAIGDVIRGAIAGGSGARTLQSAMVQPEGGSYVAWRIAQEQTNANLQARRNQGGMQGVGFQVVESLAHSVESRDAVSLLTEAFKNLFSLAVGGAMLVLLEVGETIGNYLAEATSDIFVGGHWEATPDGVRWVTSEESSHQGAISYAEESFGNMVDNRRNPISAWFGDHVDNAIHGAIDDYIPEGRGRDTLHALADIGSGTIWNMPGAVQDFLEGNWGGLGNNPVPWSDATTPEEAEERRRRHNREEAQTAVDLIHLGSGADVIYGIATGDITAEDIADSFDQAWDTVEDGWNSLWKDNTRESTKDINSFTRNGSKSITSFGKTFTKTGVTISDSVNAQDDTFQRFTQDVNAGSNAMISNFDNLSNKIGTDTVNRFNEARTNIGATITSLTSETRDSFNSLGSTVVESLNQTNSALVSPLASIRSQITDTYRTAGDEAVSSINDLSNRMSGSLGALVEASRQQMDGYTNKWNELHSATRGVSNSVIGGAERMANAVIDAFNSLQDATGNIKIDVPGYKFEAHGLQRLVHINIPRLAKGGSVKNSTYANIGEAGREAVIPLDRDTTWADTFIAKTQEATAPAMAEQNALLRQEIEILRQIASKELTVSSSDVYSAVRSENDAMIKRTGNNPLAI